MGNFNKIFSIIAILTLASCGGGGSSSGSGGQAAKDCIESEVNVFTDTTVVTNSCAYNVNILDLKDNPTLGVTSIPANATVTLNDGILFLGACRAPSAPIRESSVQFSCS